MAQILSFDEKPRWTRHLWLVSLTYPMTPLLGMALILMTGNPLWAWTPIGIIFILLPILDTLIGPDKHDLLGRADFEADMNRFYRIMVHLALPFIYLTWLLGAWFVISYDLPWYGYLGIAVSHGWGLALAINAGHETGHKTDKVSKWIALLMLAPSFLGHFRIEHNRGHHSDVATPKDHATARFGESYWAFILREYPGGWKRAWAIESLRAKRKGYSRFSPRNEVVATILIQLALWSAVILAFGVAVIPYLLIAMVISVTALSSQNYIAHYGLLREKRPDGKYLPCQPHHSWNCDHFITNITSYNLARHSDHHAHPARHYQYLRNFKDVPHMPYGYQIMFMLAYIPPLFRRVMDPLVLANVDGDMDKVLTKDKVA